MLNALPINLAIMKNPLNWAVVFFMVLLPLIAITLIHEARTSSTEMTA